MDLRILTMGQLEPIRDMGMLRTVQRGKGTEAPPGIYKTVDAGLYWSCFRFEYRHVHEGSSDTAEAY